MKANIDQPRDDRESKDKNPEPRLVSKSDSKDDDLKNEGGARAKRIKTGLRRSEKPGRIKWQRKMSPNGHPLTVVPSILTRYAHFMQLVPLKEEDENSFQGFPCTASQEDRYQTLADGREAILRVKEKI
jgi:hypothetical protein